MVLNTDYSITGTTITFNSQPVVNQNITVNAYPKEFYRLGNLFYTNNAIPTQELERVGRGDLFHLLSNNLTSTNFELHSADQTELILKILLYAGVVIQSPEIIQVAASQVQQEQTNQKS